MYSEQHNFNTPVLHRDSVNSWGVEVVCCQSCAVHFTPRIQLIQSKSEVVKFAGKYKTIYSYLEPTFLVLLSAGMKHILERWAATTSTGHSFLMYTRL